VLFPTKLLAGLSTHIPGGEGLPIQKLPLAMTAYEKN
jgi:hypothetical protein